MSKKTPKTERWHVKHARLANVIAVIAATFIGVALIELALEQLSPESAETDGSNSTKHTAQQDRYIRLLLHPPNHRQVFRPSGEYLTTRTDSLAPKEYIAETDQFGFYKPSLVHAKAGVTLAFLGGSTTENFFMAPDERFPAATATVLERRTGLLVNSINAGHSGNTSFHSVNNLLNLVLSLQPSAAILMENINDYAMLYHEGSYWNDHPTRSLILNTDAPESERTSVNWTFIIDRFEEPFSLALKKILPQISQYVISAHRELGGTNLASEAAITKRWSVSKPFDLIKITADFKKILRTFVAVSRVWGVKPVLMTQPNRWPARIDDKTPPSVRNFMRRKAITGIDYQEFLAGYVRMNEAIREVAVDMDVPLIDLATAIPPTTENFFDAIHLTGKGSLLASEYIADRLIVILALPMKAIP